MTGRLHGTLDTAEQLGVWDNEGGHGVLATRIERHNGCMACGHPDAGHDAIARRYCNATVTSALTRGCVCTAR